MSRFPALAMHAAKWFSPENESNLLKSVRVLAAIGIARAVLFVSFILLLRNMGTVQFGAFFLGYNTLAFVPLIADLGIGQTFIRHISFYRTSRPAFAAYLHRLFFVLKLATVGILVLVSWPALPSISRFLNIRSQESLLFIAVIGSGATIMSDHANAVFQSQCLFRRYELYLLLRNSLFLAALAVLIAAKRDLLSPSALILVIVVINCALAASAYPFVSRQWRDRSGRFSEFQSSLIRYSKWLTVSAICFALYRRMDIYYLSHFRSSHEVGIYSVAIVIAEPVAMISPALVTVFLPGISATPTSDKLRGYTRLIGVVCFLLLGGIALYVTILRSVFPLLDAEYQQAFPVAALLLIGTVLLIGYNMLSLIFIASDRPDVFGQIALIMAAFSLTANGLAIPAYGMLGAASVYGSCQALGIFLALLHIRKMLRNRSTMAGSDSGTLIASESVIR